MNNPENNPVEVQEQRDWLLEHKTVTGSSWTQLGAVTGIPPGTLSVFATGKYQGDNERIARDILRFRQHLNVQRELAMEAPEVPDYFETRTSRQVQALLSYAHRGRITVAATGPGCGKTKAAENYRDSMSNVWMATMRPSTAGINSDADRAAGQARRARRTWFDAAAVAANLRPRPHTNGLLIFDEAQHLLDRTIDEIRSWHDETGVGVAFLGNETVLARIEGGHRRAAFAQLYSRIGMRLIRNLPLAEDARALADAWAVYDPKQVEFIVKKSQQPGGLRTVTMMMELATMVAAPASASIASSRTFKTRGHSSSRARWWHDVRASLAPAHPQAANARPSAPAKMGAAVVATGFYYVGLCWLGWMVEINVTHQERWERRWLAVNLRATRQKCVGRRSMNTLDTVSRSRSASAIAPRALRVAARGSH
jgi:DNA transposition AAA+ family ATPase